MKRCKIRFRNVLTNRFTSGGGALKLMIEVDRCSGMVDVWEAGHRDVATMDLGTLAKIVLERHWRLQAEQRPVRSVRRGLVGLGSLESRLREMVRQDDKSERYEAFKRVRKDVPHRPTRAHTGKKGRKQEQQWRKEEW